LISIERLKLWQLHHSRPSLESLADEGLTVVPADGPRRRKGSPGREPTPPCGGRAV
jgi:hypothetical protein